MKKLINIKICGIMLFVLMSLLILFNVLVLVSVIPSDFVWGGRLDSRQKVVQFEAVAVVMSLIFVSVFLIKFKYLKMKKKSKFIDIGLWIILAYFVFNILGNLTSKATLETFIFTPVSFILSLLILRLALEK